MLESGGDRRGVRWLKTDLHSHAGDDPQDRLPYSAEMLIDSAAQLKMDVLSLTCHKDLVHTPRLAEYARQRGILLIPGVELLVQGCHVLVINPRPAHLKALSFNDLRNARAPGTAIVAPHPFYLVGHSMGSRLIRHRDVFDAVEYCSMHTRLVNPNWLAALAARWCGLPLVATSDTHALPYKGRTFSWIKAEPTAEGVVEALRAGRIRVQSSPAAWADVSKVTLDSITRPLRRRA
jgi:predicted metal-dependent phosphoesterase TrpH